MVHGRISGSSLSGPTSTLRKPPKYEDSSGLSSCFSLEGAGYAADSFGQRSEPSRANSMVHVSLFRTRPLGCDPNCGLWLSWLCDCCRDRTGPRKETLKP